MIEDDIYVINGPPAKTEVSSEALGVQMFRKFLELPQESVAMIDVFTQEKLHYNTLFHRSVNLAEALRLNNYHGQNTVLSISSENSLDFFIPVIASLFNLSILAPLNHAYTVYELEHCLKISSPKVVFCSQNIAHKFIQLKPKLGFIEKIILIGPKCTIDGTIHLDDFLDKTTNLNTFVPLEGDIGKLCALIMSSSGTTGLPKGVAISHLNLNVRLVHERETRVEHLRHGTFLALMPFFHAFGMMGGLASMMNSNTLIVFKRFDEDLFLKSIQNYNIKTLALAPPIAVFLAKSDKVLKYNLSSIEIVYCGAAPLSKDIEEEVKKRLNCYDFRQAYGLSEMTLTVSMIDQIKPKSGSCGMPLSQLKLKVTDIETGRSLGPNLPGEIFCKGPTAMMGYYNDPEATKATFTSDGWLRTGDVGYYDNDGYLFIVDRLKELIKYKGYQVAPAELEAILLNHPKIEDAGVVGLPDELTGEKPIAFVVQKAGQNVTENEILKYVEELVSPQKRLTGGVIFVQSIPKNPSGKILRRELRNQLSNFLEQIKSKL